MFKKQLICNQRFHSSSVNNSIPQVSCAMNIKHVFVDTGTMHELLVTCGACVQFLTSMFPDVST